MNIGGNNCTKSFQRPSTVRTSLHLGTRLVDWCAAGWSLEWPGSGGWQALQLCCVEQVDPSSPVSLWSAEPVKSIVLLLFSCNSHPKFVPGSLAEALLLVWLLCCLTAPWAVSLQGFRRARVPMAVPGGVTPGGSELEPEARGQSSQLPNWLHSMGKPPLGSWKWPHDVSSQLVQAVVVVAPC